MNNQTQFSALLMAGAAIAALSFATPALAANPVPSGLCSASNPAGDNWTALTTSNWTTASNWSSGVPTSSTAQTNINLVGPAQITAAANAGTALNLCNGEVDLQTGGSLTAGAIAVGPDGKLLLNDSAATVTVTDAIYLNGGLLRATTTDTFSSKIVIGNADHSTGTIAAAAGKTLTLTGPITVGAGVIGANLEFGKTPTDTGTVIYAPTAANTYAGGMTINYGTLQIGNGGAGGSFSGEIVDNDTLVFDASTFLYGGAISGSGKVQQIGTGTTILSGVNTYTGATTVSSGILTVTGSISSLSAVTVNSGGILAGTGTVGTTTVAGPTTVSGNTIPGGKIAGGTSAGGVGTLTIHGNLTLSPGSAYLASVKMVTPTPPPGSPKSISSELVVMGTANITGALLDISPSAQAEAGVKYTLLSATGGLAGTFLLGANSAGNSVAVGNYLATLSYDATHAFAQFALIQLTPKLPTNATSNEMAVTHGIDYAITHGGVLTQGFSNLALLSSAGLADAATQLSGELGSDLPRLTASEVDPFLTVLMNEPANLDTDLGTRRGRSTRLWGKFFGGGGNTTGDDTVGSHSLSDHVFGFASGLDFLLTRSLLAGVAVAGSQTNFTLADQLGAGHDTAIQLGFFATQRFGRAFYMSVAGAYALQSVTTSRTLTEGSTSFELAGKVSPKTAAGRFETGYRLGFGRMGLTPYVAVQYDRFNAPAYTETGNAAATPLALSYAAQTTPTTSFEVGTGLDYSAISSRNASLHLYGRVAYRHSNASDATADVAFSTMPLSTFTVQGTAAGSSAALLAFGAEMRGKNGLSLGIKANGALSQGAKDYFATGNIGYSW